MADAGRGRLQRAEGFANRPPGKNSQPDRKSRGEDAATQHETGHCPCSLRDSPDLARQVVLGLASMGVDEGQHVVLQERLEILLEKRPCSLGVDTCEPAKLRDVATIRRKRAFEGE